jgi:hypothetical protein
MLMEIRSRNLYKQEWIGSLLVLNIEIIKEALMNLAGLLGITMIFALMAILCYSAGFSASL